jgi:hypothetical protein
MVDSEGMRRREFLKGAAASLAALSPLVWAGRAERRRLSTKPNILLILTDDQPYHSLYSMDKLGSRLITQGMDLTPTAYVTVPVCGPARV